MTKRINEHHMARILFTLLSGVVLLTAYATLIAHAENTVKLYSNTTSVLDNALQVFSRLYELSLKGANVSRAVSLLNKGLQCIHSNVSCAIKNIGMASTLAENMRPSGGLSASTIASLVALLSLPVLVWLGFPRLYLLAWGLTRRNWIIEEHGVNLWSYVGGVKLSALAHVYILIESGELTLRDPRPPRDFLDYLRSPAYTLWFWTGLGLALAAAGTALLGGESSNPLRAVLGLMFTFFLPGYSIVEAIYPREDELTPIEHLTLSIGLSLALLPIEGLVLNFTPWHVTKLPVVVSLLATVIAAMFAAAYRKYSSLSERRGLR